MGKELLKLKRKKIYIVLEAQQKCGAMYVGIILEKNNSLLCTYMHVCTLTTKNKSMVVSLIKIFT